MNKKTVVIGLLVYGLMGCATTPKPELDATGYQVLARGSIALPECAATGYMFPEIAAMGTTYLKQIAMNYSYDASKLNKVIDNEIGKPVTKEECNIFSMKIHERKQRIEAQASISHQQALADQTLLNSTRSSSTNCTKIGAQLFCNTF